MASNSKKVKYSNVLGTNHDMDSYSRHKQFVSTYLKIRNVGFDNSKTSKQSSSTPKNEYDIIKKNYQFIRDEKSDKNLTPWEIQLVNKYYNRLFKEYCICNIKHYKSGKIAMRWRTEKEVIAGKGQFICGSTRCSLMKSLTSWEVNFHYCENGDNKFALVKLRLCPTCSIKLNYRKRKKSGAQHLKISKKTKPNSYNESNSTNCSNYDQHDVHIQDLLL